MAVVYVAGDFPAANALRSNFLNTQPVELSVGGEGALGCPFGPHSRTVCVVQCDTCR